MLKQLTKIKIGVPMEAKVTRITKNDEGRVAFYFEGGFPPATFATATEAGKEMLRQVKDAYGAERLADFKDEVIWISLSKKNGYTNTSIVTVLVEEEPSTTSSAFEVVDE